MRPNVTRDKRINRYLLIAVAIVGVAVVLWFWYRAVQQRTILTQRVQAYQLRKGEFSLQTEVDNARRSLSDLETEVDNYKKQVGFSQVSPFKLPPEKKDRGSLFRAVYDQTRSDLTELAQRTNVDFQANMGFNFPGEKPPPDAEAQHWSIMLQLVSKAVFLALQTNFNDKLGNEVGIRHVSIAPLENGYRVATGPAGRPPLLREYPFRMTVQGSLKDVLWLIYELGADRMTHAQGEYDKLLRKLTEKALRVSPRFPDDKGGVYTGPLIVRGLHISSENMTPIDQISQLTVVIDLAGMVFLDQQERDAKPVVSDKTRPQKPLTKLKIKM